MYNLTEQLKLNKNRKKMLLLLTIDIFIKHYTNLKGIFGQAREITFLL